MSLLEEVPSILDYVTPKTMAALLSSSSSLRRLVHSSATALTLKKADLPVITALVNGGWSQLKHLNLSRSLIDLSLMSALVQGQWPVLQSLKLVKCHLSCEVAGRWRMVRIGVFGAGPKWLASGSICGAGKEQMAKIEEACSQRPTATARP